MIPPRNEPEGGLRVAVGRVDGSLLGRGVSIIERMVIDMDEAQVRTLEQVRKCWRGHSR